MDDITYEESRIETEEEEEIMKEINEQLAGVDNSAEKKETLQPWRDAISTLLRKNNIAAAVKKKASKKSPFKRRKGKGEKKQDAKV